MASLKEISYNILNAYRGGRSTNNEHISLRQIMFNVKYYRALLLRRDFQRNGIFTRHVEQDLGCLELVRVNASQCCNLPIECSVSRTRLKLPRTIRFNYTEAITSLSDVTGLNTIPMVNSNTVQFLPNDRFTKNEKKGYMIEDYLYIYNADGMDVVNIRGIFEDPEEVAKFDCGGQSCYDPDSDFPISMDLLKDLTDGILKGTFALVAQTGSDTENDTLEAAHMPTAQPKAQQGG